MSPIIQVTQPSRDDRVDADDSRIGINPTLTLTYQAIP